MKMRTVVWVIPLCLLLLSDQPLGMDAKRVVVIPTPSTSHVLYSVKVAQALHDLGHHIWLTVPHFLLEKGVLNIKSNITVIPFSLSEDFEKTLLPKLVEGYLSGQSVDVSVIISAVAKVCDEMLQNTDLVQSIRDTQPEFMVLSSMPPMYPLTVLPYKLRVPFGMIGSVYDVHAMRIPYSSAADPSQVGMSSSDDMTFLERVKSMFLNVLLSVYNPFMPRDVVSIYAPEMPYISNSELLSRAEVWLLEMDHILDYPRPTLPNVKLIGGTVSEQAKPLPAELQTFMDSATHGAVIVTFGGSVLAVPKAISDKLFWVFHQLPFKVVFRSNLTSPDPDKVWTSRWLPQNDLLGHPNTKVFVSHCGKSGQYEALFHAVPLLCTPMFAEQLYNSERIRKKGFGEMVDLRTVSQEELLSRILTVAQDPGYKLAISKASSLFRQQFGVPMQEAAKWLDHVMQYGGDYMRYAGQKMALYQFLALDVLAFVFALGVVCCVLLYCCGKVLCTFCCKRKLKAE